VATLDKTVTACSNSQNISVLAAIARIDDKNLQRKVAEKTKDWTNEEARKIIPIIKDAPEDVAYEIMEKGYDVQTANEKLAEKVGLGIYQTEEYIRVVELDKTTLGALQKAGSGRTW